MKIFLYKAKKNWNKLKPKITLNNQSHFKFRSIEQFVEKHKSLNNLENVEVKIFNQIIVAIIN